MSPPRPRRTARLTRDAQQLWEWLATNPTDRHGPTGGLRKSNRTDSESAKMATDKGVTQGLGTGRAGRPATTRVGTPGPLSLTPTPRPCAGTFGVGVSPTGASERSPRAPGPPRGPRSGRPTRSARGAEVTPALVPRRLRGRRSRRILDEYSTDPDRHSYPAPIEIPIPRTVPPSCAPMCTICWSADGLPRL